MHDEVDCNLPGKLRGGEPLNGTPSRLTCRLVDFWIARAHDISGFGSGERSATQELMYLHSDLAARRVVPRLPAAREDVDAAAANAGLARPDWAGLRIRMPG